jgi:hypothetical protein
MVLTNSHGKRCGHKVFHLLFWNSKDDLGADVIANRVTVEPFGQI